MRQMPLTEDGIDKSGVFAFIAVIKDPRAVSTAWGLLIEHA